jgi:hypothetical protein
MKEDLVKTNARGEQGLSKLFELGKRMRAGVSPAGAKSCQQGFEALAIVVADRNKLQTEPAPPLYVTNDSVGFDTPFLNQEIELGGHVFFHTEVWSLDK